MQVLSRVGEVVDQAGGLHLEPSEVVAAVELPDCLHVEEVVEDLEALGCDWEAQGVLRPCDRP
jgi:hypothetical protein